MRELPKVNNIQILASMTPQSEGNLPNTNTDLIFLKMSVGLRRRVLWNLLKQNESSEPKRPYSRPPLQSPR